MTKNVDLYVTEIERLSLTMFGDATVQRVLRASDRTRRSTTGARCRRHQLSYAYAGDPGNRSRMYIFANDGFLFTLPAVRSPDMATSSPTNHGIEECASKPRRGAAWPTGRKPPRSSGANSLLAHSADQEYRDRKKLAT